MTPEQNSKHQRLKNRIEELNDLNVKIGRLSFYLSNNGKELDNEVRNAMEVQLDAMNTYRCQLEYRIEKGWY